MRRIVTPLLLLLPATLVVGCAKYNYEVVRPESSRMRIADDWQRVAAGPVSYKLRTMENHLVVLVYNTTDEPMRILGDRSYIVTPEGQSVPLQSQAIAPGTYVKLVLPPLEQITNPGPSIGIGFGYSTGRVEYPSEGPGVSHPEYAEPVYLDVTVPSAYWQWEGEGDATLHLVFEQAGKTFDQTFVFHRVKV